MDYRSTRSRRETDLITAVMQGLAADGGLFVPVEIPHFDPESIRGDTLPEIAAELLLPFFSGSPLEPELRDICDDALDFAVPLTRLQARPDPLAVLELFHGPTAAFKDVGARFLAAVMERSLPLLDDDGRPVTILVATSGDTGGAVAAAFHGRSRLRVGVLFPKGQVSARQQHQLTCWGGNVRSFEVEGSFDDCQALAKAAFRDPVLSRRHRFSSANSINLGRLLPQVAYHAASSLWHWREAGMAAGYIVPTGNLGNGLACVWARAMGMPIREIVFAINSNLTIPEYLATGKWRPRPSVRTLASAMDVGDPSNMERLFDMLPDFGELRATVQAYPVDDDAIRAQIRQDDERFGRVWCPHTATGFRVYDQLAQAQRAGRPWIVCATAHPAKFESITESLTGHAVPVPDSLQALLALSAEHVTVRAEVDALAVELDRWNAEFE